MPEATSSCSKAWGVCLHDPRCEDRDCPGHPTVACSTCSGGPCPSPEACLVPLAELQPIKRRLFAQPRRFLPASREAWGRVIGAALGAGGLLLFLQAAVRHLFFPSI